MSKLVDSIGVCGMWAFTEASKHWKHKGQGRAAWSRRNTISDRGERVTNVYVYPLSKMASIWCFNVFFKRASQIRVDCYGTVLSMVLQLSQTSEPGQIRKHNFMYEYRAITQPPASFAKICI